MSLIKKFAAVVFAVAAAVIMCALPAGAITMDKLSMNVKSENIYDSSFETGRKYYYKMTLPKGGEFAYRVSFESYELKLHIYDTFGEELYSKYEFGSASDDYFGLLEDTVKLRKGTYYIMLERVRSKKGSGDVRYMFTFPTSSSSSSEKDKVASSEVSEPQTEELPELGFIIYLHENETLALGTSIGGWENPENVSYKTSDKNIAKVSTDGEITAVGAGKAVITAKYAGRSINISVRVLK